MKIHYLIAALIFVWLLFLYLSLVYLKATNNQFTNSLLTTIRIEREWWSVCRRDGHLLFRRWHGELNKVGQEVERASRQSASERKFAVEFETDHWVGTAKRNRPNIVSRTTWNKRSLSDLASLTSGTWNALHSASVSLYCFARFSNKFRHITVGFSSESPLAMTSGLFSLAVTSSTNDFAQWTLVARRRRVRFRNLSQSNLKARKAKLILCCELKFKNEPLLWKSRVVVRRWWGFWEDWSCAWRRCRGCRSSSRMEGCPIRSLECPSSPRSAPCQIHWITPKTHYFIPERSGKCSYEVIKGRGITSQFLVKRRAAFVPFWRQQSEKSGKKFRADSWTRAPAKETKDLRRHFLGHWRNWFWLSNKPLLCYLWECSELVAVNELFGDLALVDGEEAQHGFVQRCRRHYVTQPLHVTRHQETECIRLHVLDLERVVQHWTRTERTCRMTTDRDSNYVIVNKQQW